MTKLTITPITPCIHTSIICIERQTILKVLYITPTTPNPPKSFCWFCLILLDSIALQYSPANGACSHVYQIHQTLPTAFVAFSALQYSPANRACSHVYQIHQTPPAAFVGFSALQYSPANRACSHVYQNPSNSTGCFCWIQYSTA